MNLHSISAKAPRSALVKNAWRCALAVIAMTTVIGAGDAPASRERVEELVRLSLQLDPDAARGVQLYGQHCAGCHLVNAVGNPNGPVPALAGQREAYLIKQLADFAELERQAEQMHSVISKASLNQPQDWVDVAAYLSRLPPVRQPELGSGSVFRQGAAIFAQQCVECHADDAHGDEDGFVPALRGQHYSYLIGRMHHLAALHGMDLDPELIRFINGMQIHELTAVADYLSRLRGPVRERFKLRDDIALRD